MVVVSDGGYINAVVANMLIVRDKMGTSLEGTLFHSKHICTFLVKGVDGNGVVLGDGLVLQLKHDRLHNVPSMVSYRRTGVVTCSFLSELVVI